MEEKRKRDRGGRERKERVEKRERQTDDVEKGRSEWKRERNRGCRERRKRETVEGVEERDGGRKEKERDRGGRERK